MASMVTRTSRSRARPQDENSGKVFGGAKRVVPAAAAPNRRALGDLSNKVGLQQQPPQDAKQIKKRPITANAVGRSKKPSKLEAATLAVGGISVSSVQTAPSSPEPMAIEPTSNVSDIDMYDHEDPQSVTAYVNEIFEYLFEKEQAEAPSPDYMSKQVDITPNMRAILMDWLVEVHLAFRLLTDTLFQTALIVDLFLELVPVSRNKLQLVGITSMLIASKYEEIYSPEVNDFIYMSDQAYTREEVLKMESAILNTLGFNLGTPTPIQFLRRFSKAARSDSKTHTLSKYLLELALVDYGMLKYSPSTQSAASVYLARALSGLTPFWSETLEHYTQKSEDFVLPCVREMNELLRKSEKSSLKAVKKKYTSRRFLAVASLEAHPGL